MSPYLGRRGGLHTRTTPPVGLPTGWQHQDIGTGQQSGDATYNASAFTVVGSGTVFGTADQCHFVYQTLSGNYDLVARIASHSTTGTFGQQVGLMVRTSLADTSANVYGFIDELNQAVAQWRLTTSGTTDSDGDGISSLSWIKIAVRTSGGCTVSYSSNGSTWTVIRSGIAIAVSGTYYAGLAVSSSLSTERATGVLDNVTVTAVTVAPVIPLADYGGYRPSYQGYGVYTPGGRGGTVLRVTNLNDSGTGSLRAALEASGPRIVIFEISGTISLSYAITVTSPFLTIAGQTAPSPGILIRGPGLIFDTHNVVIQHIRVRVGNLAAEPIGIWLRDDSNNMVVDHCSMSWGVWDDIAVSALTYPHPPGEIAVIDCIISEPLGCSGVVSSSPCNPDTYPNAGQYSNSRGMGVGDLYGGPKPKLSVVRTLWAHINDRQPEICGATSSLFMNNVYYNPSLTPLSVIMYQDFAKHGPLQSIVKNNVMIGGPTTPGFNGYVAPEFPEEGDVKLVRIYSDVTGSIYMDGNYYSKDCGGTACLASSSAQWVLANDMTGGVVTHATSAPFTLPSAPLASAMPYTEVESYVSAHSGARPLDRDVVDTRIVSELAARTGSVPNRTSDKAGPGTDASGFPILSQVGRSLTVPANPNAIAAGETFRTNIEVWLESMALELEGVAVGSPSASVSPSSSESPSPSPSSPPPAITVVDSQYASTGPVGTTLSVTLTGVQAGDVIVAIGIGNFSTTMPMTIADDKSNTYSAPPIAAIGADGGSAQLSMRYALNVASGSTIVTLTVAATDYRGVVAVAIRGVSAFDVSATGSGTGTFASTSDLTTTGTGIIIAATFPWTSGGITQAGDWTLLEEDESWSNVTISVISKLSSAGVHTPTWTVPNAGAPGWSAVAIALK